VSDPRSTREALGLAPTRGGGDADSAADSHPPRLKTQFWSGIKLMLLMNILPLMGVLWLAWGWYRGRVSFARMTSEHVVTIIAVVLFCVVIASSYWFVMPFARWLRDYPAWQMRHAGAVRWFIPAIAGFVCWLVLLIGCVAATGALLFVIATAVWRLAHPG